MWDVSSSIQDITASVRAVVAFVRTIADTVWDVTVSMCFIDAYMKSTIVSNPTPIGEDHDDDNEEEKDDDDNDGNENGEELGQRIKKKK